LQAELDLSPLWDATGDNFDWSQHDVLLQVQGPLLAMPCAWLKLGKKDLFQRAASVSSVVSLTLRDRSARQLLQRSAPERRILSAQWEQLAARGNRWGLPYLHFRLHEFARAADPDEGGQWECWSLGDDPMATISHLQAALNGTRKFGVVVIGAHGNLEKAGVLLADEKCQPIPWSGEGTDLHDVDVLILVCCAVGHLSQDGTQDVEGLYTRLVSQGAKSVIAAKWPIADVEAAELASTFMEEYSKEIGLDGKVLPFGRARAFHRARMTLLNHMHEDRRISFQVATAFDLYGLG
jgi:CHAT domain-containing protein